MSAYFGKYRGIVKETSDPQSRGRVRALVPDIYGDDLSGWALPCSPLAGDGMGWFAVPPVGAAVWLEFEHGDPDYPIWSGCFWSESDALPQDASTECLVLRSAAGHRIVINDARQGGGMTLETADGQKIVLSGQTIELTNGSGATIKLWGPKTAINGEALEVT